MFWWITSPWTLHFRLGSKEYCNRKSVETILWIKLNVSLMFHPFFLEIYLSSCLGRFLSSFRKWNVKQNLGSIQAATVLPNAQNAIFKMGMWARGHSWPIKTWMEFSHWPLKNICLKFVFYQEILPFVVLVYVQRRDPPSPQDNTSVSIFREIKSIFFLPPQQAVAKIHLDMWKVFKVQHVPTCWK